MISTGNAPVGYRFSPKDEELVNHYLKLKMLGYDHQVSKIAQLNVCDYEPWDLPQHSVMKTNDPEWYFFCPRNYKYSNSQRANRTTEMGYWKVTGKDQKIMNKDAGEQIGTKKILVFYKGRASKGLKTNWTMHEYSPTFTFPTQRDFVLCKLKTDPDDMPIFEEGESSFMVASNFDDMPIFEEGKSSSMVASNFENQISNVNNHTPTFEEGDEFSCRIASDFEDSHQLRAYLKSFGGCDEKDYNLNSAIQFRC